MATRLRGTLKREAPDTLEHLLYLGRLRDTSPGLVVGHRTSVAGTFRNGGASWEGTGAGPAAAASRLGSDAGTAANGRATPGASVFGGATALGLTAGAGAANGRVKRTPGTPAAQRTRRCHHALYSPWPGVLKPVHTYPYCLYENSATGRTSGGTSVAQSPGSVLIFGARRQLAAQAQPGVPLPNGRRHIVILP